MDAAQGQHATVDAAADFARKAHADQRYGDLPYISHCGQVAWIVGNYTSDPVAVQVGWLHDVLEDTSTTYQDLNDRFGSVVAEAVEACTGRGMNRRERNAAIYRKIGHSKIGALVKVCDRIANVESCWKNEDTRLFMYYKEHDRFFDAVAPVVCADNATYAAMKRLNAMFGWIPRER